MPSTIMYYVLDSGEEVDFSALHFVMNILFARYNR